MLKLVFISSLILSLSHTAFGSTKIVGKAFSKADSSTVTFEKKKKKKKKPQFSENLLGE